MLDDLRIREFSKDEARNLNALQLALIGDGVYEIFIRNYVLSKDIDLSAHKIHVKAIGYVKAKSQSTIIHNLECDLTEEELYIFKRGRNTKSATVPKNADVRDYRAATGFEALIGYLYLIGDKVRLAYILSKSVTVELN
ncbi:Mini-ribonuclease 3 [Clostridium gasigenes]|uniref:Mini-ribonuclease 3 n=1 Tax=Clostridium gasigenes TaxID=94869 RepID=UPI0014385ED5|nr:ribonuclease III domain-containing protein [Clostridium gasigenes]MBU3104887.1 Mini-ribonuclease 3 [Clostridium gasigenes]MBU3133450.1 Mini-ribonuclease 3 [Clostridium gasigenes]MBU3137306.1 Mini-ribonuclease 3 [Clostridium gasigenes]NKF07707.1 Mini-ribonuclease 3 [Clostridium gasigenes]QSW20523.1 Mini-ribonuclease 3 [Clostridium gasigenes]